MYEKSTYNKNIISNGCEYRFMTEKAYEKYAWILLFAIGVIFLVAAVPATLGINTDPGTVERIAGMTLNELQVSNPGFYNLYIFYFSCLLYTSDAADE